MRERHHDITRLEAFSDAVFAFALTLLVVSLEVPRSYPELMALARGFVPFGCCFALLIWIWYEHSALFSAYPLRDRGTVVLNACLLFVVLFYVYPLKYVTSAMFHFLVPEVRLEAPKTMAELAHLFEVYGAGFIAVFAILAALYHHAWRMRGDLHLTPLEAFEARGSAGAHLVSASVGVISVLWAFAFTASRWAQLAGFLYFLMAPFHFAYGWWLGKRREEFLKRHATSSAV